MLFGVQFIFMAILADKIGLFILFCRNFAEKI